MRVIDLSTYSDQYRQVFNAYGRALLNTNKLGSAIFMTLYGQKNTCLSSLRKSGGVFLLLFALYVSVTGIRVAQGAPLDLPDAPLFVGNNKNALVQLVVQRDNKLFFEAYPSYEDINSDGVLDIRYKPNEIDYYGYFSSGYCYQNLTNTHMESVAVASNKQCSVGWSGDFLNFLTMTRMDIMLKALYGGKRHIDSVGKTILRRAFVPIENHTWGIAYDSIAVDGYDIRRYTPLDLPASGRRHLFATNNINMDAVPYLRVREDTTGNIWEWVDKERTQGDGNATREFIVDVEVCKVGFLDESCKQYPDGSFKPIGLLHEYGGGSMYFGLLTGSYENNLQGGVLRQTMRSFSENEVDPLTGQFTGNQGIVSSLDALQIHNDFRDRTVQNDCGFIFDRSIENGECSAWGNPIAEMMYEGMRYLSGTKAPTPQFYTDGGIDAELGLQAADWDDPYSPPYGECASAHQMVISDPSPSFDGDQLPGSYFSTFRGSGLPGLDVGNIADTISRHESAIPGLKFIGQVGGNADGAPTPKYVTTFRNIRGQSPEAPHREGSYYAPSVAYYGHQNDIQPNIEGDQTVKNYTLALGSPLPSINVEVNGANVSFAPFAKTVEFCGNDTPYKPTNAIVGFTVESIAPSSGSYRISFEDMEQGGDNDMDAVARYSYEVVDGQVKMTVDSLTARGCGIQHLGFIVSGSSDDGVYLLVRDSDTGADNDPDYNLDVPPGGSPGSGWNDNAPLPLTSTVFFTPSSTPAAKQLPSPLWYAAKWGGFNDENEDGIPQLEEWDANGDGLPDNYFPVSDPSRIAATMRSVFNQISEEAGAATSIATSSGGSLTSDSRLYQAVFTSGTWHGELTSIPVDSVGAIDDTVDWAVSTQLEKQIQNGNRKIISYNPESGKGVPFTWPTNEGSPEDDEISRWQVEALNRNPATNQLDYRGFERLDFLRGNEVEGFRERSGPLGDIINSSPQVIGEPSSFYPDYWGAGAPENNKPYTEFVEDNIYRDRVVYVGANDGMLHGFDAGKWDGYAWSYGTGEEVFAYVPSIVFERLSFLTSANYSHKAYIDASPRAADVFINDEWRTVLVGTLGRGGQGIYALDVTNPESISEDNADTVVLWEFTDQQDADLGYIYSSPIIARMQNGKWAAIVANGYNNSVTDVGFQRGDGQSSIFIIDIESGDLIRKLTTNDEYCQGTQDTPNGMSEPTAIDFDNDGNVDTIYAGDLFGCVYRFDVSSSSANQWLDGELKHKALDTAGERAAITASIAVGTHPTGEGVLLYFGTGKYLEPADQTPTGAAHRFYAIWDKGAATNTAELTAISARKMLEQTITVEDAYSYDSNDDGIEDTSVDIRETSQNSIDWEVHNGWYIELAYDGNNLGEQVISSPLLRDGRVIFGTHMPIGDVCTPGAQSWLMILRLSDGAMLVPGIIGIEGSPNISGLSNGVNPFSPPTVVTAGEDDVILTQMEVDPVASSTVIYSNFEDGRLSWRELDP